MRARRHRGVFLVVAAAVAGVLASGMLQAVPGVARAGTGPAVTGVSPSTGPLAGGTKVTITGTGFTGATGVDFGSAAVPASSVTVNGDTSITATAPATAVAGPVDVTVTTPAGTSAAGPADQYSYADEFSHPPAGASAGPAFLGPGVGAVDQNGNPIDVPYYIKPGADYSLTSSDDGSGENRLIETGLGLSGTPKDQWVQYFGENAIAEGFIGDAGCSGIPWPLHTMNSAIKASYTVDPGCWQIGIDLSMCGNDCPGIWDVWVPTTVTDADGQTLVFDHWSGSPDISHCDTGDQGYVQNWPGAGNSEAGIPGAFTAGEQFNVWADGGGIYAHYAPRSAGTTGPLIELDAPFDCQWYAQNSVVAPKFSCVDLDGSGVKTCTATAGVTADGKLDTSTPGAHTVTITATDNNGSTRTMTQRYFVGQPPAMTITPNPSAPSATGWYNASQLGAGNTLPVTVAISPSPSIDSIDTASCTLDGSSTPIWSFDSKPNNPNNPVVIPAKFSDPGPQTFQVGQGTHTLSCTAKDLSGAATTQSATYQVDTTLPAVTGVSPSSGPLAGGTAVTITGTGFTGATGVDFGSAAASSVTVNDDGSITATAPAAASGGPVDVTVTTPGGTSATSPADQYSYVYPFTGFAAPVASPPVLNIVHAGQSIPIQFQLGGNYGLNVLAAGYPTAQQVTCDTDVPDNTATATDTAGASGLQYDATTGTYTYVWKTSKAAKGTCQLFTLQLNDGTSHTALFKYIN